MKKNFLASLAVGLLLFGVIDMANAASFTFNGNITYHNDVVQIAFTLDSDTTNVKVWTDSFMDGTNFDPITGVWKSDGTNYNLIAENDDDATINPTNQTYWDSGMIFSSLTAGDYLFTIATYDNFANGPTLTDGFRYTSATPILLANWDQPSNGTGKGTYYRVNLEGVSSAVPIPGALWLLGSGIFGLVGARRKLKK